MQVSYNISLKNKKKNSQISTSPHPQAARAGTSTVACNNSTRLVDRPHSARSRGSYTLARWLQPKNELLSEQKKQECSQISRSLPPPALMHDGVIPQNPGTPWSRAPRTWVQILSFPTPPFRGPIYFRKIYQFIPLPSEFCWKIAPWNLALHPSENKGQAENKEIIKIGTTGTEGARKAYCVTT